MGFVKKWVDWISLSISSVEFSVVVNDGLVRLEKPRHGLKQGGPLSPICLSYVPRT